MLGVWINKHRQHIPIGCMTDQHIRNTLRMIESGRLRTYICNGMRMWQWRLIFYAELKRRGK